MITQHMRYTAGAMVPTGDFLAHVGDWTGLPPRRAARSDARRGAGVRRRVGGARAAEATIADDADGQALLESDDDPAQVLAALRAFGGDTGAAVSGYLDLVGCRPLDGFDISRAGGARAARRAAPLDPDRRRRAATSKAATSTT